MKWVTFSCFRQNIKNISLFFFKGADDASSIESNMINIDDILPEKCGMVSPEFYEVSSDFKPRVVSGFETTKGNYPWQVSSSVLISSFESLM